MFWQPFSDFIQSLESIDYLVLAVNTLLIIFAQPTMRFLFTASTAESKLKWRVRLLRALNVLIMSVYGYRYMYLPAEGESYAVTLLTIVVIFYIAYLCSNICNFFIYRQYGRKREFNGTLMVGETYQTRLFTILANILIAIITLIAVIQELGFQSLLETGGVLGFIGVMLALTQGAWAPDIISGLIILNSDLFEEGDVIELENGHKTLGTVFKTKIFHTEVLNLVNNHRIMIKNALLREHTVHNLSKFASARGLRECLSFKIGYDVKASDVKSMFEKAYADMLSESIPLAEQHGYEVKLLDTGDHALEWGFIYYVKEVEKLVTIRRDAREYILQASIVAGISLATPLTYSKAMEV